MRKLSKRTAGRIRKARGDRTLAEFSELVNCSISRASTVERGLSRPTVAEIPKWCEATGLDAEDFIPELKQALPYMRGIKEGAANHA